MVDDKFEASNIRWRAIRGEPVPIRSAINIPHPRATLTVDSLIQVPHYAGWHRLLLLAAAVAAVFALLPRRRRWSLCSTLFCPRRCTILILLKACEMTG